MIAVEIVAAAARASHWSLTYEVVNRGAAPVWINDDGFLAFRRRGRDICLSFARAPVTPGAIPFGYFAPVVARLGPGESLRRDVELDWPLRLSRLWNAMGEVRLPPGDYGVRVEVGYADSETPPAPDDEGPIEDAVLRWQKSCVSGAVTLAIDVPAS
ncbi:MULTISPECIES: hypothetical protein [unclassified Sphingopyxis]|uniref:hypothetical protein n=1 Tax=unclassified Sphingopyxis TaxID=2614943 RepID=UPI0007361926|nr:MULTISPECIES: hypothetical protein [unclassified Sphingopyxis]KTE37923.1 hypothetical protein ATE62_12400 [Sphingopyxis sp. HIX]KTE83447.1 hypothetical protein ATE72_13845 [Sphingopyxis sp. HXXIV]